MVYSWLKNTQFALFPGRCVLCSEATGRHLDLCCACEAMLVKPWARCRQCALPCPTEVQQCGQCSQQTRHFTRSEALTLYQTPVDELIGALKYRRHTAPGRILAELLCAQLRVRYQDDQWPDGLLPVPLHWRRQWHRGFNQAHFLAVVLGKRLQIPVAGDILVRQRATPKQQGLNQRQRQTNLKRAFRVTRAPDAAHVALIDDVVTTGATCNELAALLLHKGASRVDVWCLARTDHKSPTKPAIARKY